MKIFKNICLLSLFILINSVANCQKYAKEFIRHQDNDAKSETVYLKYANEVIRTDTDKTDSLDDKKLLEVFNNELYNQLFALGFNVVNVPKDSIITTLKANEHLFEVIQLEVEEFIFYDSVVIVDENEKEKSFYESLNGVRINSWFCLDKTKQDSLNINQKNTVNSFNNNQILFNETEQREEITDVFIEEDEGKEYLVYDIAELTPNAAYSAAFDNANISAVYLFNLLLNRYVGIKSNFTDKNRYGISSNGSLIKQTDSFDEFMIINN